DLIDIWINIAGDNEQGADKLLNRFEQVISTLATMPEIGTVVKGLETSWSDKVIRFFPIGDYIIFYHFTSEAVVIVRVIHAAQDYTRIFGLH
ncbi:MAG: type II toxin-antitoxin system RelE/ParE family toxin, partial [Psychrosphaera sp.]|nr:type II toxin-antitoxin system RelE/ParE family toxin [Psychrosphaera sp.]